MKVVNNWVQWQTTGQQNAARSKRKIFVFVLLFYLQFYLLCKKFLTTISISSKR